jgi:hypothetical protein
MLDYELKFLPQLRNLAWTASDTTAARREIQQQVFEWMKQYSFPSGLVAQYEGFARRYADR